MAHPVWPYPQDRQEPGVRGPAVPIVVTLVSSTRYAMECQAGPTGTRTTRRRVHALRAGVAAALPGGGAEGRTGNTYGTYRNDGVHYHRPGGGDFRPGFRWGRVVGATVRWTVVVSTAIGVLWFLRNDDDSDDVTAWLDVQMDAIGALVRGLQTRRKSAQLLPRVHP